MSALDPADHASAALLLCREIAESYELLAQVVVGLSIEDRVLVARELLSVQRQANQIHLAVLAFPEGVPA